jgi:exodeoxyribonuclease V beta subunit
VEQEKDLDEGRHLKEVVQLEDRKGPHAFPAGTKAGNFFHEIFETIEFDAKDFSSIIPNLLNVHGLSPRFANLANEMIISTLFANLNKHNGQNFQLKELSFEERIEEMEFHLHANDFHFHELGQVIEAIEPGNAFAEYLTGKEVSTSFSKEQMFFKGFIDLIFRRENKYYILDWKSNLLGGNQESFSNDLLLEEMKHADYLLQYHLYTIALHRFLSQSKLEDYDYDLHFGGVYYLFIRGMSQNRNQDDGIFFDRPSKKVIETIDQFLTPKNES